MAEGTKTVETWQLRQAEHKRRYRNDTKVNKTKFNNFESGEDIDYDELERKIFEKFINGD